MNEWFKLLQRDDEGENVQQKRKRNEEGGGTKTTGLGRSPNPPPIDWKHTGTVRQVWICNTTV